VTRLAAFDLLRIAPLFAAMPAKVVEELAMQATRRRARAGQRVRVEEAMVLLVTGRLEVRGHVLEPRGQASKVRADRDVLAPASGLRAGRDGRVLAGVRAGHGSQPSEVAAEAVIRSLVPPAVVGLSIVAGAAPTAELWAGEDSELLVLPASATVAALRRHPEAALAALVHLGGVIGELSTEIAALRVHGLVERVRHRLRTLAAGRREVVITHARLAEEVGGTRANVSRALARLEREGALHRRRGRIELS